jgi:hypothetical protein
MVSLQQPFLGMIPSDSHHQTVRAVTSLVKDGLTDDCAMTHSV